MNDCSQEKIIAIVQKLSEYENTVGMLGVGALRHVREIIESEVGVAYEELLSNKGTRKDEIFQIKEEIMGDERIDADALMAILEIFSKYNI